MNTETPLTECVEELNLRHWRSRLGRRQTVLLADLTHLEMYLALGGSQDIDCLDNTHSNHSDKMDFRPG